MIRKHFGHFNVLLFHQTLIQLLFGGFICENEDSQKKNFDSSEKHTSVHLKKFPAPKMVLVLRFAYFRGFLLPKSLGLHVIVCY